MKGRRAKLVILNVILLVMLVVSVNGSVLNEHSYQALLVSCETPKVILQSGTTGSSTIYTNSTSAKVSVTSSDWWDSRWRYRRPLSINNTQNADSLSNYLVFVNVTYDDDMKIDFSDLRFAWYNATPDVEAEVPYWIEKKVNSTYAETWIEVPEILSNTYYSETNTTMNMYYGNPDASSVSNADDTFAFFADFENSPDGDDGSSEGFTPSSVAWVVEGKEYSGDGSWEETHAGENWNDYVLRGKINIKSVGIAGWYGGGFMFRYIDWTNYYIVQITPNADWVNLAKVVGGVWTDITGADYVIDLNTDYIVTIKVVGSSIKVYIDENLVINTNDSALSNGKIALYVEEAHVHFDDIRVREYTEPEPTIDVGTEETITYDYVLQIVNQDTDGWEVNLKVYDSFNIGRLSNATISLHDGTTSDQIIVSDGVVAQSEGLLYDLAGSTTIYISMSNLQATTSETSYLYVYLKILVPSKSTYNLFVITFEIT